MASKACSNDATVTMFVEQLMKNRSNTLLARCMAMLFCVRGVTHQQAHANSCCKFTKSRKVCAAMIYWCEIKFEIARMHNDALRSVHDDCVCVRHRVSNREKFNIEWTNVDALAIAHSDKVCLSKKTSLFNAVFCKTQCDVGTINRE